MVTCGTGQHLGVLTEPVTVAEVRPLPTGTGGRSGGTTTRVDGGDPCRDRFSHPRRLRGVARFGHVRRACLRLVGGGRHPPPRPGGQRRAPTPVQGAGGTACPCGRPGRPRRRALEPQQRADVQRPLRAGADAGGHHAPRHVRLASGAAARVRRARARPLRSRHAALRHVVGRGGGVAVAFQSIGPRAGAPQRGGSALCADDGARLVGLGALVATARQEVVGLARRRLRRRRLGPDHGDPRRGRRCSASSLAAAERSGQEGGGSGANRWWSHWWPGSSSGPSTSPSTRASFCTPG